MGANRAFEGPFSKKIRPLLGGEAACVGEVLRGGGETLYIDGPAPDPELGVDSVLLVINRTSTRRFLASPADVLFDSAGLSLPSPIREILWAGILCADARYGITAFPLRWLRA